MLQALRDTNNPFSALNGHSLLRDVYGTDGFVARVFVNNSVVPQYAGATLPSSPGPLGATEGQLIDIFMQDDDPNIIPVVLEAAHIIQLDRAPNGSTVDYDPSPATDYYSGCLLTMLEGPATGQTTRIVDYRFMGNRVYRLRVMVFSRADGEPLQVGGGRVLVDLIDSNGQGYAFMVNGRPINGTGVGFNPLAEAGKPRLNVVELHSTSNGFIGTEMALTPNRQFINVANAAMFLGGSEPFSMSGASVTDFQFLNSSTGSLYPTAEGPGGADESYDAPDYQNVFLGLLPLEPRARGRLVDGQGLFYELGSPEAAALASDNSRPMRFDLENMVLPSYHRPALVNFWYHRLLNASWLNDGGSQSETDVAQAILWPYGADGIRGNADDPATIDIALRDQIVAIKRKIMLRPITEDHPNFNGSNPASRSFDSTISTLAQNGEFRYPFWETMGPWDVDNDNDGVNDSVWIDLGDPVQKTEDGRLYKPLYAFLIVDLDGRLNLNAHGSVDHFADTNFDPVLITTNNTAGNLTGSGSSNIMPTGMGWGTGDVSLRPILSPLVGQPYNPASRPQHGDPTTDDYARLFMGRLPGDFKSDAIWGRLGSVVSPVNSRPGKSLEWNNTNGVINPVTRDPHTPFDFVGYPVADQLRSQRDGRVPQYTYPSAFGSSPDLRGRYATGIDYTGQPTYEAVWDSIASGDAFVSLVEDSPYETNLSATSRRGLPGVLNRDDDAPFAAAEMERLLRSYDPETGTAPSRLWDLVDSFDPNKYVLTISSTPANPSGLELAIAQANTSMNRRQVTTDSYEIPVPADVVPSYVRELGADGKPGIAGVDDDGNGTVDDISEIGLALDSGPYPINGAWPDDFASLTGHRTSSARLVDVLWYRIQRNRIERGQLPFNLSDPADVAQLNAISEQLLPPEVLAGQKMDLNRPFGDGRDNNGNGLVDEPIEAGEPYLDDNNNGKWDPGEKFADLDGDGKFYADKDEDGNIDTLDIDGDGNFEPIIDNLWAAQLGTPAMFDHTMGKDVTGRTEVNGNPLRDDAHLARQLYARHLYCLMLLLSDEDYLAPYNPVDPQVLRYLRIKAKDLQDAGMQADEAKLVAQRKYTYRQVAQWAVNCVDFRDSDATMTPFEYDENPWDGWNCVDTKGTPDDPSDDTYYPIDGDPGTDENHRQLVDWPNMADDGLKVVLPALTTNDARLNALDQTRNLLWGAERPELLISETTAFHDNRLEDFETNSLKGDNTTSSDDPPNKPQDNDLDQRLRPRGSFFVELYNPWSTDGPRPVELYRNHDGSLYTADTDNDGNPDATFEGVLINRLSTVADSDGRRSPVWRLVVVEEHPEYRNNKLLGGTDNNPVARETSSPHRLSRELPEHLTALQSSQGEFMHTDLDWDEMFIVPTLDSNGNRIDMSLVEKQQSWSKKKLREKALNPINEEGTFDRNLFAKPYPYIEREMYFNSGGSFHAYSRSPSTGMQEVTNSPLTRARTYTDLGTTQMRDVFNSMAVRIPFRYITLQGQSLPKSNGSSTYSLTYRFISARLQGRAWKDVPIAPVLPGRYCVIGSAGTPYRNYAEDATPAKNPRFTTTIGRILNASLPTQTKDSEHLPALRKTRRIELIPSGDPTRHQLLVGANGGRPGNGPAERHNEMIRVNAKAKNVNDSDGAVDAEIDSTLLPPAVVVPVENMNISEPIYGYEVRQRELDQLEQLDGSTGGLGLEWKQDQVDGEGAYVDQSGNPAHFDTPFDEDTELREEGTVPNYRVVHLQRLADPMLPWNPPAGHSRRPGGVTTDQHDKRLPINPYRTIDSASVDLMVFNGTSSSTNPKMARVGQFFRSKERGATALARAGTDKATPLRNIWSQERASRSDELTRTQGPRRTMLRTEVPDAIRTDQFITKNHFDMVLNHTLGFANEAFGDIYLRPESKVALAAAVDPTDAAGDDSNPKTLGIAAGAPRPDKALGLASTYPWFNWNNRPFVSGNELLQVPAASSSTLLRRFSVMNTTVVTGDQLNAYDGGKQVAAGGGSLDAEKTNEARFKGASGHFGHLLNLFQSTRPAATIEADASGKPVPIGSPNYHRILDYIHTPSRFVATDTMLNPVLFAKNSVTSLDDPRQGLLAPFNRVALDREPGKVNWNTMVGQRNGIQVWSAVYDGLTHRVRDGNVMIRNQLIASGHFGPAWRDVVLSRRGYADSAFAPALNGLDRNAMWLDRNKPTFFANPFRSSEAGDLVPLENMVKDGVQASMLRTHPYRPGANFAWGSPGNDSDGNGLDDDAREAGPGGDSFTSGAPVPLFSELSSTPAIDGTRNSGMQYMPLTRLDNLTTTRSGVFAVWVTVGYFEVTAAPSWDRDEGGVQQKFLNQTGGNGVQARALYDRVYPQGYQLGKELGSDTGDIDRQRAFYIIDRTRPVAFKPGEDINVEKTILLRRRIE